jgi:hypothetical protein
MVWICFAPKGWSTGSLVWKVRVLNCGGTLCGGAKWEVVRSQEPLQGTYGWIHRNELVLTGLDRLWQVPAVIKAKFGLFCMSQPLKASARFHRVMLSAMLWCSIRSWAECSWLSLNCLTPKPLFSLWIPWLR